MHPLDSNTVLGSGGVRPYLGGVPTDSLAIRFGAFQPPKASNT